MERIPKNIQIRNVPDEIHQVLVERAAGAGQSLQEYLLASLRTHVATKTNAEIFAQLDRERREHPEWFTDADISAIIREDRRSH